MKIAAFEVRPDEKTSCARWAKVYNADVTEYSEVPSLENASLAAGCVGVTFLGQGKINRELLAEYKKLGVKCVSKNLASWSAMQIMRRIAWQILPS